MKKIFFLLLLNCFSLPLKTIAQTKPIEHLDKRIQESRYAKALQAFTYYEAFSIKKIEKEDWLSAKKYADSMLIASEMMVQITHRYDSIFARATVFIQYAEIANHEKYIDSCLAHYKQAKDVLLKNKTNKPSFAKCDTLLIYTLIKMIDYTIENKAAIKSFNTVEINNSVEKLLKELEIHIKNKPIYWSEYYRILGDLQAFQRCQNLKAINFIYTKSLMLLNKNYAKNTDDSYYLQKKALLHRKIGVSTINNDSIQTNFNYSIDILTLLCTRYPANNDFQQDLIQTYQAKIEKYLVNNLYDGVSINYLAADVLKVDGFLQYSYQERRSNGIFNCLRWLALTPDAILQKLKKQEIAIKILRNYTNSSKNEVVYHALIFCKDSLNPIRLVKIRQSKTNKEFNILTNSKRNDSLWQPIAMVLNDVPFTSIYFSAAGIYSQINIETFKINNYYLIENYTIHNLSVLRNIIRHKDYFLNQKDSLIICELAKYNCTNQEKKVMVENETTNVNNYRGVLSDLAYAPIEKNSLCAILNPYVKTILENEEVTLKNIKQKIPNHAIVWLIGHGGYSDLGNKNLLDHYGYFTRCHNQTDGKEKKYTVFTGNDASNLDLNLTNLVVLSLCEGNKGELVNYEGVYSLAHGFQMAGAKIVLAAFDKIDDKKTADFMAVFANYIAKGKSYTVALRQVKLDIIKEKKDSSSWKSFMIIE